MPISTNSFTIETVESVELLDWVRSVACGLEPAVKGRVEGVVRQSWRWTRLPAVTERTDSAGSTDSTDSTDSIFILYLFICVYMYIDKNNFFNELVGCDLYESP